MKPSRPATAVFMVVIALAIAAAPVNVGWKDSQPFLAPVSADAKNGGSNGGGNGRGGKGVSGSNSGKGQNGSQGKANGRTAPVARKDVTPDSVAVRYRNGYLEQVTKGRFIMKDSKGRTIVNRKATAKDHLRLWLKTIAP